MKLFIDPDTLKAEYAASPAWLQDADERLGRRPELLPLEASRREAARDHALRAVDGAVVHRRQHRRRHRAREPARSCRRSTARRRRASAGRAERGSRSTPSRAARTASRSRRRTPTGASRAAADQSAHVVLLPLRAADGERRRAERVRRRRPGDSSSSTRASTTRVGWMHTSSGVDDIDEYLETVDEEGRQLLLQVRQRGAAGHRAARSRCRTRPTRGMAEKKFTVYRTHHGPIVREPNGKWVAFALMQEPVKALTQSYSRTKATRLQVVPADRWSCTPTRRTTRSSPTPTATSRTSTATSFRSATRASTGRSRWTAAIRRPTGRACSRSTRRRTC